MDVIGVILLCLMGIAALPMFLIAFVIVACSLLEGFKILFYIIKSKIYDIK